MEQEEIIKIIRKSFDYLLAQINNQKAPKIYESDELSIPATNTFVSILGLSCSGKTTFVNKHFRPQSGITINRLNADELVIEMIRLYQRSQLSSEEIVEYFIKKLRNTLCQRGDLTVCENNNITVEMRKIILNSLNTYYNNSALIILNPTWEDIVKQNEERNEPIVAKDEVERIMLELQLSDPQKYFIGYDEVFIVNHPRQAKVFIRK